jgi:hypothetical protein
MLGYIHHASHEFIALNRSDIGVLVVYAAIPKKLFSTNREFWNK